MSTIAAPDQVEPLAVSLRQAGKLLGGVSPTTVSRLIDAGEIHATRLPGINRVLVRVDELDRFLRDHEDRP